MTKVHFISACLSIRTCSPFSWERKGNFRSHQTKSWHIIKLFTEDLQGMWITELIPEFSCWKCLVTQISMTMNHKYRHKKDKCNAMTPHIIEEVKAPCITSVRPYLELSLQIPVTCFMIH